MAENSHIEWCDHTFNPWIGCTKVSPGCANCYAAVSTRARVLRAAGQETWGKGAKRSRTKTWGDPFKWNRAAAAALENYQVGVAAGAAMPTPVRPRVFCASLADWLDDEVSIEWLSDLLYLVVKCSHLDWLLLTKRPTSWKARMEAVAGGDDIGAMIAKEWLAGNPPPNVWLGTTVEDQTRADERIPVLLSIPAKVRFLSCEPLLGFTDIQMVGDDELTIYWPLVGKAISDGMNEPAALKHGGIHWVIAGGESGPGARPMHPGWARSLRDQCKASNVPFLFKQWGEWCPITPLYEGHDDDAEDGGNVDRQECLTYSGKIWNFDTDGQPSCDRAWIIERMGKKASGRLLDGVIHHEFPRP